MRVVVHTFCWRRVGCLCYNLIMTSFHQLRQQRTAIVNWTADKRFSHALTLNTDRVLTAAKIGSIFKTFCLEFDRRTQGRNLKRMPQSARLSAIAFPENLSTNAHLHAFADLNLASEIVGSQAAAVELARVCWMKATNGAGTFFCKPQPDSGWGRYCTKRFTGTYYLSADFWPH